MVGGAIAAIIGTGKHHFAQLQFIEPRNDVEQ
jgi:hypothetical protein